MVFLFRSAARRVLRRLLSLLSSAFRGGQVRAQ
jgi:hypothetical protein